MAYKVKGKNGLPIKKDGAFILGFDIPETKIEQLDDVNKTFLAVASTEDEDRDKDVIRLAGWDLANFKKNPVLPWGHNYYEPSVGKAVMIKKDNQKKRLIFKPQFDKDDEKAMLIFNKYKNGYLNTFSVGFLPKEFKWRDEDDRWYGGREFTKQELLEISPVTVPANPHAGVDMRGLEGEGFKSLLDFGYKQFMTKTESGIFYPIMDIELFTAPKEIQVGKGIRGVFAHDIDNPESTEKIIGYIFEEYDEKTANSWISQYAPKKSVSKYFEIQGELFSDDMTLEVVEEETQIVEEEPTEEKTAGDDDNLVVSVDEDSIDGEEIEEKDTDEEVIEEKTEIVEEENEELTEEKTTVEELVVRLEEKFNILLEKIDELSKGNVKETNVEETNQQSTDEIIELDKSLFTPVNDTDNSKDFIEMTDEDFKTLKEQKIDLKKLFEENIALQLKKTLDDISGKID